MLKEISKLNLSISSAPATTSRHSKWKGGGGKMVWWFSEENMTSEKQKSSEGFFFLLFLQGMFCAAVAILVYTTAVLCLKHWSIPEFFITEKLREVIWERGKENGVPNQSKQHLVKQTAST